MANPSTRIGWKSLLETIATVCVICASIVFVMFAFSLRSSSEGRSAQPPFPPRGGDIPREPISIVAAPSDGERNAPLVVIAYTDFQCPYCAKFAIETLPEIREQFIRTGRVRFVLKHLPLNSIHPHAAKAAVTAECSGRQGRFWEMHDLLFREYRNLGAVDHITYATELSLSVPEFQRCLEEGVGDLLDREIAEATAVGIRGTPTFFFGRAEADGRVRIQRRQSGALSPQAFAEIVEGLVGTTGHP